VENEKKAFYLRKRGWNASVKGRLDGWGGGGGPWVSKEYSNKGKGIGGEMGDENNLPSSIQGRGGGERGVLPDEKKDPNTENLWS